MYRLDDFVLLPTNELIQIRDKLNLLISDRKIENFTKRMQELIDEIHTAGCSINFEVELKADTEYRKHDALTIYSDDPSFSFEVM